jgi:hypothetical protein
MAGTLTDRPTPYEVYRSRGAGVSFAFLPYPLARCFEIPGTEDERVLYEAFDLALAPARGQELLLPGESEPRRVARVIQIARPVVRADGWTPGFTTLPWVTVELEAEPASAYETAVEDRWKTE